MVLDLLAPKQKVHYQGSGQQKRQKIQKANWQISQNFHIDTPNMVSIVVGGAIIGRIPFVEMIPQFVFVFLFLTPQAPPRWLALIVRQTAGLIFSFVLPIPRA